MRVKKRLTDLSWLMVSEEKLMLLLQNIKSHDVTYTIKPETVLMMECLFEDEMCYLVVEKHGECHLIHESIKELKKRYQSRDYLLCKKNTVTYCAGDLGYSNRGLPFLTEETILGQFKTMHGVPAWINLKALTKVESFKAEKHLAGTLVSISPELKLIIPVQYQHVKQRMSRSLSIYYYYLHLMIEAFKGTNDIVDRYRQKLSECQPLFDSYIQNPKVTVIKTDYERFMVSLTMERVVELVCKRNKTVERQEIFELLELYLML